MPSKKALLLARIAALRRQRAMAGLGPTRRVGHDVGRPILHDVIQPLYDTEGLAAVSAGSTPADLAFFATPIGQTMATGATKSLRDTNLSTAGQLPRPKVHIATGIRVVPSLITGDETASGVVSIPAFRAAFEHLASIMFDSVLRVEIGPKPYWEHPVFLTPPNAGFALSTIYAHREAATGESQGDTSADTGDIFLAGVVRGPYGSLAPHLWRIPSLQTFRATITWPSTAVFPLLGAKVSVYLDGIHSREVA